MAFHFHIDYPTPGAEASDLSRPIVGWVSSDQAVRRIELRATGLVDADVKLQRRPDVEKAHRFRRRHQQGFESSRPAADWLSGQGRLDLTIRVYADNAAYAEEAVSIKPFLPLDRARRLKSRLAPLLACPQCRRPLQAQEAGAQCNACRVTYPFDGRRYIFLTESVKQDFSIIPTDNVSAWDYDPVIQEIIARHPDELFLDCGAGFRKTLYDNVINYEIAAYPSTDMLGVGECLPFSDGSLDGVFSVAVLEHVQDPFRCASEIVRVLKPGGLLFCAAGFLAPVHAYPHHYYNMTSQGLCHLFRELDIQQKDVPLSLHPMVALTWMMRSYTQGLPEPLRRRWMNMKVKDFLALGGPQQWHQNPIVQDLTMEQKFELGMGTTILAKKRNA